MRCGILPNSGEAAIPVRNVIGPDEYHEGVDDNAYTNGMAQCPPDMPVRTFLAEGDAVEAIALRRRA